MQEGKQGREGGWRDGGGDGEREVCGGSEMEKEKGRVREREQLRDGKHGQELIR